MNVLGLFIFRVGLFENGQGRPRRTDQGLREWTRASENGPDPRRIDQGLVRPFSIQFEFSKPDFSLMGGFQTIICSRISTILEIQLGKMFHSYKKIAANQGALYDSKKRDEIRKRLRIILLSNISIMHFNHCKQKF